MSKRIRNQQPSAEKIERARQAYKICKLVAGDDDRLILNIIKMHPNSFIKAARAIGIKKIGWKGLIDWIEENKEQIGPEAPSYLRPGKINYIKMVRTITGCSLKEAKELVEEYCYEKYYLEYNLETQDILRLNAAEDLSPARNFFDEEEIPF